MVLAAQDDERCALRMLMAGAGGAPCTDMHACIVLLWLFPHPSLMLVYSRRRVVVAADGYEPGACLPEKAHRRVSLPGTASASSCHATAGFRNGG